MRIWAWVSVAAGLAGLPAAELTTSDGVGPRQPDESGWWGGPKPPSRPMATGNRFPDRNSVLLCLQLLLACAAASDDFALGSEGGALLAWRDSLSGYRPGGHVANWSSSAGPCDGWGGVTCAGGRIAEM